MLTAHDIPIGVFLRSATPSVSINVTLDGCCDHCAMFADEELHRHARENLDQADALLFGRVTYENDGGSVAVAGADGIEA